MNKDDRFMNEKGVETEKEKYDFLVSEMKLQSNLIKHLISEIDQLKQILILSKSTLPDVGSNPQPVYDPINNLLSIDRPMQKPPSITDEETMSYPTTNISFPLDDVLTNLTDSDKDLLLDKWKKCQEEYKIVIESKKDDNHELFINGAFNVFSIIFDIMIIFLKFDTKDFSISDPSLIDIAKKLGPLPILLDFDLVDFINEQKKNKNYSIGKKTASNLLEKIEKTVNSLGELLNLIL